jgi:hypothetical protein
MFDNICKFLAETFSTDFANWLLRESIELISLSLSELSLEPIRADAIILRQSEAIVLHCEFQTEPNKDNTIAIHSPQMQSNIGNVRPGLNQLKVRSNRPLLSQLLFRSTTATIQS